MMVDKNGMEYEDCIAGNIIGNHFWGEQKEIKSGTKHFKAGTKVYCVFIYGGMGHEHIHVMGKPRNSFQMIDVVIRATYIKNFRLQKTYDPQIINFINQHKGADALVIAEHFLKFLNENHVEIREESGSQSTEGLPF